MVSKAASGPEGTIGSDRGADGGARCSTQTKTMAVSPAAKTGTVSQRRENCLAGLTRREGLRRLVSPLAFVDVFWPCPLPGVLPPGVLPEALLKLAKIPPS